ncbi:MAG: baseplate J/gp47 family protein [Anaerolineales bacterium]
MKVQVLQLDAHDDQVSVRDKLAWTKAPRVLLVWPDRGRILTRRLDLVLLLRQAHRQRAQLGVVTPDREVVDHAAALGIPIFDSADQITESGWRKRDRRPRPLLRETKPPLDDETRAARTPARRDVRRVPSSLRPVLAGTAILALAGAAVAALPSAVVVLSPAVEPQSAEITFDLIPENNAPSVGGIVTRRLTTRLSGELRRATTGQVSVPTHFASGEVVFENLTGEVQTIPVGQTVREPGREDLFFVTREPVVLEAGEGSRGTAAIQSAIPGQVGNLPADSILAVDGPVGLTVSVSNPAPTTGGGSELRAAPTEADRRSLRGDLVAELLAQAEAQWASLSGESRLAPGTSTISRVVREEYSADLALPADSHSLSMEIDVSALEYEQTDLEAAVGAILTDELEVGRAAVPGSLRVDVRPEAAPGQGPQIHVLAVQQTYPELDRLALGRRLAGVRVEEASQMILAEADLSSSPAFHLRPGWFPSLPWLAVRIEILWIWEAN